MNQYIIPANTKKSQLILGFFTPIDLALFGSGCSITILMLIIFQNASMGELIIILLPALITGFLVTPVLYYHNILQLITNIVTYILNPKRYRWRGWCIYNDETK